jgi:hypothetical protein
VLFLLIGAWLSLQEDNPDLQNQLATSTAGYKDLTAMVRRTASNHRGSGEYGSPR